MKRVIIVLFVFFCAGNLFSQDGNILSKSIINLSDMPIWVNISKNDTLTEEFAYLNKLNFYFIKYESDGLVINGILCEPKKAGKYPVVIFNRGGNRSFGNLTVGMMILFTSKLSEQGYVIIGSNLRAQDEFGGAELNDILNLTKTIKQIEKADTSSVGMFGWSRGGMMTYLALSKSEGIKTAIVGNGPTNLFSLIKDRPEMETGVIAECVPNYAINKELELQKRSVIFWPEKLNRTSSLLILSGTRDVRVNPKQADDLAVKLAAIKYDFELKIFETDHAFSDKQRELNEVVIKWFDEKLKNNR